LQDSTDGPALDQQTRNLLESIRKLYVLASESGSPIAASREEVVAVKEAVANIESLKRTIEVYDRASRGVPHVAFIGQFSAGKSSLINALTRDNLREVGEGATDKIVTIISHPGNVDNSANQYRYRMPLDVGPLVVDNAFLKDRHLVDMPGTGDEESLHTLVREFLPVCDWIILVTPTSHAFDLSETAIVRLLHTKLSEVPVALVVTRTSSYLVPGSSTFDKVAVEARTNALIKDCSRRFGTSPFVKERVYFVANHEQRDHGTQIDWRAVDDAPGVAELRRAIETLPLDLRSAHSAKVELFSRWTCERAAALWDFLDGLSRDLTSLIAQVEDTRRKYQASFDDGLQRFDNFWKQSTDAIESAARTLEIGKETAAGVSKSAERTAALARPITLTPTATADVKQAVEDICAGLQREADGDIRRLVEAMVARVNHASVEWTDAFLPSELVPAPAIQIDYHTRNVRERLKTVLHRELEDHAVTIEKLLRSSLDAIEPFARKAIATAEASRLLDVERLRAGQFTNVQNQELPKILQHFEGYRAIVFVNRTQALVARTGFGKKLDEHLDATRTDQDEVAAKIAQAVFGSKDRDEREAARKSVVEAAKNFRETIEETHGIFGRTVELRKAIGDQSGQVATRMGEAEPAVAWQELEKVVTEQREDYRSEIQEAKKKLERELGEIHKTSTTALATAEEANRERLRRRVWNALVAGAAVGLGVALLYSIGAYIQSAQTVKEWDRILWVGVVGNLVSSCLVYAFNVVFYPPETLERNSRADILKKARGDAEKALRALELKAAAVGSEKQQAMAGRVAGALLGDVTVETGEIRAKFTGPSKLITLCAEDIDRSQELLFGHYDAFRKQMGEWYSGTARNTKIIKDILVAYKDKSIDEAIKLFSGRRDRVEEFKTRITDIVGGERLRPAVEEFRRERSATVAKADANAA
jgi:hypothetical protein